MISSLTHALVRRAWCQPARTSTARIGASSGRRMRYNARRPPSARRGQMTAWCSRQALEAAVRNEADLLAILEPPPVAARSRERVVEPGRATQAGIGW